jgi:pimeloyl-[acyl-carrier protein] methyl ester esterase
MGGGVGFVLGLEHPERLDGLVLMAPIPAVGIGEITPEMREERMAERRAGDREAILRRYQAMRFREDVETDDWFESRVEHLLAVSDGHFEQSAEAMAAFNVADSLDRIETPTLMIAGGVDSLLKANLTDFLKLPNATLEVIARAGHEVAVHEPERVAQVIDAFMRHGAVTAETLMRRLQKA